MTDHLTGCQANIQSDRNDDAYFSTYYGVRTMGFIDSQCEVLVYALRTVRFILEYRSDTIAGTK